MLILLIFPLMMLKITLELCLMIFSRTAKSIFGDGFLHWHSRLFRVSSCRHRSLQYGRGNGCRKPRVVLTNIAGLLFHLYMAFTYMIFVVRSVCIIIISLLLRERVADYQGGKVAGDFWLSSLSLTSEGPS